MAITQAMLDAERERVADEAGLRESVMAETWDACLAFLREHGTSFYGGEVDFTGDYADPFVRVEIPAR